MNDKQLRDKYKKAQLGYNKYSGTSPTNQLEKKFLPLAQEVLEEYFTFVKGAGNKYANFRGVDFACWKDEDMETVDMKLCLKYCNNRFLMDAVRRDENGEFTEHALDSKICDYILFINQSFFVLATYETVYNKVAAVPEEDYYDFLDLDKTRTVKKCEILLDPCDCVYIKRRKN